MTWRAIGFLNRFWSGYWSSVDTRKKINSYFSELYMYESNDETVYNSIRRLISRLHSEQIRLKKSALSNLIIGSFVAIFSLYFIFTSLSEIDSYSRQSNALELQRRTDSIRYDQQRLEQLYRQCGFENNGPVLGAGPAYLACIRNASRFAESITMRLKLPDIKKEKFESMSINEIYSMITRFTFIILLQIISFFFLKLYVSNNVGIKYFANEITNLESRYIAFMMSKELEGDNSIDAVIHELARTERNFILVRGERTAFNSDEPKLRDLSESLSSLIDKMKGAIK